MNTGIEFTMKLSAAYSAVCRPLCHELNLPQTAFDILMFLANNPEYTTARDIVEIRKIKANLVSINVDKLVGEGYLRREVDTDDRRKTHLLCTDKAGAVIEQGRALQNRFMDVFQVESNKVLPQQGSILKPSHQNSVRVAHVLISCW